MSLEDDPTATSQRGGRGDSAPSDPDADTLAATGETPRLRAEVHRRLFGGDADPVRIGRFVVLYRVGAGGMGVVYAAYDQELDRKVAIKLLAPGVEGTERQARLLREAKALGRFSHPSIVQVYEAGTHEGGVYVAMEFVDGETLRGWREETERSVREVLAAYIEVGRGLLAAHRAGVVHRDFKPDNAIVGRDGRVRVLDFGLARDTGEPSEPSEPSESPGPAQGVDPATDTPARLTQTGALLGTPAYMAPEQWRGRPADARSDQFAFAVSLFEALFGARPFQGSHVAELSANIIEGNVAETPVTGGSRLRAALMRALDPDPARRFPDMEAMLSELEHVLSRRRRILLGLGAALAVAAVVAIVVAWRERTIESERADALAVDADTQRERANFAEEVLVQREYDLRMGEVSLALERDPTVAVALLSAVPEGAPHWRDGSAWAAAQTAAAAGIAKDWVALPVGYAVARVSASDVALLESLEDATPAIWSRSPEAIRPIEASRYARGRFSADGTTMWMTQPDGEVRRWDTGGGPHTVVGQVRGERGRVSIDDRWAISRASGTAQLLALRGGPVRTVDAGLMAAAVSADGSRGIGSTQDALVYFTEDEAPQVWRRGRSFIWHDVSDDLRWAALAIDGGGAELWDLERGTARPLRLLGEPLRHFEFRPGHDEAAATSATGEIARIDLESLAVTPLGKARSFGWSPDGSRLWLEQPRGLLVLDVESGGVRRLVLPRPAKIRARSDGGINAIDESAWRHYPAGPRATVKAANVAALLGSSKGIVAGHLDGTLRWWDSAGEVVVGRHEDAWALAVAHDASVFVTAGPTGLRAWRPRQAPLERTFDVAFPKAALLAIAPRGNRAGIVRPDGSLTVVDLDRADTKTLRETAEVVPRTVFFSASGQTVYVIEGAGGAYHLRGWDVGDGRVVVERDDPIWRGVPHLLDDGRFVRGTTTIELMGEDGSSSSLHECPHSCSATAVTRDGRFVVDATRKAVRLIDVETGGTATLREAPPPSSESPRNPRPWGWFTLAPDGQTLYFVNDRKEIESVDLSVPTEPEALRLWLGEATTLEAPRGFDWQQWTPK